MYLKWPLLSHVTAGGKGSQAGIIIGEHILEINGNSTKDLVHVAAQKLIKSTGQTLTLTLDKSTGSSPVTPTTSSIAQQPAKGIDQIWPHIKTKYAYALKISPRILFDQIEKFRILNLNSSPWFSPPVEVFNRVNTRVPNIRWIPPTHQKKLWMLHRTNQIYPFQKHLLHRQRPIIIVFRHRLYLHSRLHQLNS